MQVYADNAATTRMSDKAVAAMLPLFPDVLRQPLQPAHRGQQAAEALADARQRVAACLGVQLQGDHVYLRRQRADNQAIISAARIGARKGKKSTSSPPRLAPRGAAYAEEAGKRGLRGAAAGCRPAGHGDGPTGGGRHP